MPAPMNGTSTDKTEEDLAGLSETPHFATEADQQVRQLAMMSELLTNW